jgi:hypothetical protein
VRLADARAEALRADGKLNAGVYNPAGVGGTNVLYVLADATRPEDYGLPRDPTIPWRVRLWKGPLKWVGNAVLVGGVLGAFLHYLRYGPKEVEQ